MGDVVYHLEVVPSKSGKMTLKVRGEGEPFKAFHSLYDPEAEARAMVNAFQFDGTGLLVVMGLGLGYHVWELYHRFPSTQMVVVEVVPDIYEKAKTYGKISDLLEKVTFMVGSPVHTLIRDIMEIQSKPGMSPITIFNFPPAVSLFNQYYGHIALSTLKSRATRSEEKLLYPKFKGDQLKICLADLSYFLNQEVEKALRRLGHTVVKIRMRKGEEAEVIVRRMMDNVLDFKPDFILTINHIGFDKQGELTRFFKTIEMPVASWYVDSPNLILKAHDKNVSPYVSLFMWDRSYIKELKEMGFEDVTYLPMATDELLFKPIKLSKSDMKRYAADVAFVGDSMVAPTRKYLDKVAPSLYPLIGKMAERLVETRMTFPEVLKEVLKTLKEDEEGEIKDFSVEQMVDLEAATLWKATLLYRLSCVKALEQFKPTIHGDGEWTTLLGSAYKIKPKLHYYQQTPLFYNACAIHFNATNFQMFEAVNQRVFDVPASERFLITDHQPVLDELFEVGKEMIAYNHKKEIPELVRFYLHNPKAREAIARKGRERILKEHTYLHRLNSLLGKMRERYG